jgi:hypothetical protein
MRSWKFVACLCCTSLLLALLLLTPSARAESADEATRAAARTLGYAGVDAFQAGDHAGAYERLEKAYALLFTALKQTGYVGLAKVAMHNREHIVLLRPGKHGLILHTLYYRDEVRAVDEFRTDTSQVKEKELDLATMLIETLAASFEPEKYVDIAPNLIFEVRSPDEVG